MIDGIPQPLILVCHFFDMAIYGVGRLLLPFPSLKRMWIGARLISVGINLAFNLLQYFLNLNIFCLNTFMLIIFYESIQRASGLIFLPIIKAEGVRQMLPATVLAYYRAPPEVKLQPQKQKKLKIMRPPAVI